MSSSSELSSFILLPVTHWIIMN